VSQNPTRFGFTAATVLASSPACGTTVGLVCAPSNAIAGYGLLQNHIARRAPLGSFTDENNADTDGRSLALALRAGYDFHLGPVTTGPVVGAVLQQVGINGFTETGSTGLTALSFGQQTWGSAVSQLGWRGSVDADRWQLFADMEWNHELAGRNHTVTASLTSIAAPSWSAAAVPLASDWATASVGVAYKLGPQVIIDAAVSAMFANPRTTSCGGELGLNVSF
jgi:outer membrane lipase/esterase